MKTLNKLLIASTVVFASMGANAELISTDWKTTGDSLSTLDEVTGIEWLDFSQTQNMSILTVQGLLDTTFSGWRLPTRAEVQSLMNDNGFFDHNNRMMANYFGYTYNAERTYGLFLNDTKETLGGMNVLMSGMRYGYHYINNINQSDSLTYRHGTKSVFLVSDGGTTLSSINNPSLNANNVNAPSSVPLPATALLMGLGLTGFMRRKQKK